MAKPQQNQNTSELTKESQWWFHQVRRWLGRVPFFSLWAFIMCVGGIVVFSVCLYKALEFLVKQFDIGIISKIVWLVMILHIVIASWFLVMAILSTGGTRKDVCGRCVELNVAGRLCHIMGIAVSYLFHFIWLILPAALLLPVVLLTAFAVLCRVLPDCISLSDYGIPPGMVDKVNPDDIIDKIRSINSTDLNKYIDQAEGLIQGALEAAEDSPILEDILTKIENNIPDEAEIERFVSMVIDNIDTEKVIGVIDRIQEGIDSGAEKIQGAIDTVVDQVDKIDLGNVHEQLDNLEDNIGEFANKTRDYTDDLSDKASSVDLNTSNATDVDWSGVASAADRLEGITVPSSVDDGLNAAGDKLEDVTLPPSPSAVQPPSDLLEDITLPTPPNSRSIQKRQTPGIDDGTKEKAEKDLEEIKTAVKQNIDNIREGVSNSTRDANERAQKELGALRNQTEQKISDIQNQAKDMMNNVTDRLEDAKDDIVSKAEDLKNEVKETADTIRSQAEKTAEELKEEAERTAEDLKQKATAAAEEVEQQGKQLAEDVSKAVEAGKERIRQGLEEVKALGNETLRELSEKGRELVDQGREHLEDVKDRAQAFGEDVKEKAEQTVEEFVDTAKQIAQEAKMIADIASQQAEKALQKALDAAKAITLEVDKKAKELAREAEVQARTAAENARRAANDALEKAKQAIQNADDLAEAVTSGSAELIRKAAMNVRHYAKEAIRIAKYATAEAVKGAREAAKMFDSVKEEVLKGYEIFMTVADQLGIERKQGSDTFCSEAKVVYCNEITKSHIYIILVFGASLIMNVSFLHFLMTLTANYVHVKRELKEANLRKQIEETENTEEEEKIPLNASNSVTATAPSGKGDNIDVQILALDMSDTGSFITRI